MTYSGDNVSGRDMSDETSEELRADIASTRNQMSQKLDAIQDQFKPERIREQAQETVRNVVDDSVEALRSYVNDNSQDLSATLGRSIKRHPLPAALVGIGLGWLLIESFSSDSGYDGPDRRYYSGNYRGGEFYGSPEYGQGYQQFERADAQGLSGYPQEYVDEMDGNTYRRSTNYGSDASNEEGIADRVQGAAKSALGNVQDAAQGAMDKAKEGAQSVSDAVQGGQSDAASVGQDAQRYSRQMANQAQQRVGQWGNEAQYQANQAQYQIERAGRQAYETIEDNPLMFGLVALGVGAAIGLALPDTLQEDRLLGDTRDRVFDAAQEAAGDVATRAQRVVEEVRPEVEQTVQNVASNLQDAGKQAVDDLKQTGKESAENAKEMAKSTAEDVKETAKSAAETAKDEAKGAKDDVKARAVDAKNDVSDKTKPQG